MATTRISTQGVLLVSLVCLCFGASRSQAQPTPSTPDIGVQEKLSATVPRAITLVGEQGERMTLAQLLDKPTVLTLNYFRCTGLCSPLLNGVAEAVKHVGLRAGTDYQVLTVSFDPRDDAELALAKKQNYIKQLGSDFPAQAWRFLTGDPTSTAKLADAVGFKFAKVGPDYVHPGVIIILSPAGKVTRYMYGISFLPFDLKLALIEAAEGRTGPTINKVLQFCYSYDPAGRTYFLNITRVTGAFTLLLALGWVVTLAVRGRHSAGGSSHHE